jgi:arylsulfatase A-like enzyme
MLTNYTKILFSMRVHLNRLLPLVILLAASALESSAQAKKTTAKPATAAAANPGKPNIVIIWGDDVGWYNISAYNLGSMGYKTPNIDRLAKEGALFTDWYGQNSCTAGRAAFITGQSPIRTGLLKVGLPGAKEGMTKEDPTIADLLKAQGYATGQFGKNHLGDRDEHLPTNHGFDEFYGNLYHLNAEEEPENPDYPKNPEFKKKFGPRGVIHSWANADGTQRIEDTGPLTKKRMETIDYEVEDLAVKFMKKTVESKKPMFLWFNTTRMHIFTHLRPEAQGKTGLGIYPDGMVEHDAAVGRILKAIDDLGIADNTIVMYSTDNGAEVMSWPDGGTTPFRGEKNTQYEGAYRVPTMIRWPGTIKPGTVINNVCAHEDMLPTLVAAAGGGDVKSNLLKGMNAGGKNFNVHLDGYNLMPYLKGDSAEVNKWPRREMLYWTDGGQLAALRFDQWKLHFLEQRAESFDVWQDPFVPLRTPKLFSLRADPFERADEEGIGYDQWRLERVFLLVPAQAYVGQWLQSFAKYPPRQKPGSFNLDQVMEDLSKGAGNNN